MKKTGIIHPEVCEILAKLGHMDTLVICDAGLPIPDSTRRVDLAFSPGQLPYLHVLTHVLQEIVVEHAYMSQESLTFSPDMQVKVADLLGKEKISFVPHVEFKKMSGRALAILRTGEFTPYSSVILVAGCAY